MRYRFGLSYTCLITGKTEVVNWESLRDISKEDCIKAIKEDYPLLLELVELEPPYKTIDI